MLLASTTSNVVVLGALVQSLAGHWALKKMKCNFCSFTELQPLNGNQERLPNCVSVHQLVIASKSSTTTTTTLLGLVPLASHMRSRRAGIAKVIYHSTQNQDLNLNV